MQIIHVDVVAGCFAQNVSRLSRIIVGATWPDIFIRWRAELLLLCVLSGFCVLWVWWKQ